MPGNMDVEGDDERIVCHVVCEAKCVRLSAEKP